MHVCLHTACVCLVLKEASDPLELELQVVMMSHHVGSENHRRGEPSLQPAILKFQLLTEWEKMGEID